MTHTMDEWYGLARDVQKVRDTSGWTPCTPMNFAAKMACAMRECMELARGLENAPHARSTMHELCDVQMYCLTALEDLAPGTWTVRPARADGTHPTLHASPMELIKPLLKHLTDAVEFWRKSRMQDAIICVEFALREAVLLQEVVDPHETMLSIREKLRINASRGHLHGKGNPEG